MGAGWALSSRNEHSSFTTKALSAGAALIGSVRKVYAPALRGSGGQVRCSDFRVVQAHVERPFPDALHVEDDLDAVGLIPALHLDGDRIPVQLLPQPVGESVGGVGIGVLAPDELLHVVAHLLTDRRLGDAGD